jgi:hypothetical protein
MSFPMMTLICTSFDISFQNFTTNNKAKHQKFIAAVCRLCIYHFMFMDDDDNAMRKDEKRVKSLLA